MWEAVAAYQALEASSPPNKDEIAKFFVERFTKRYITPVNSAPRTKKHGFCTMAVSCLVRVDLAGAANFADNREVHSLFKKK